MDIIELPGYTIQEKCIIARKHLVPKQLSEHGLVPISVEMANVQNQPSESEADSDSPNAAHDDEKRNCDENAHRDKQAAQEPMILPERVVIGDDVIRQCAQDTPEAGAVTGASCCSSL